MKILSAICFLSAVPEESDSFADYLIWVRGLAYCLTVPGAIV